MNGKDIEGKWLVCVFGGKTFDAVLLEAEDGHWEDGKLNSAMSFKFNGEKCSRSNIQQGYGVLVEYNEDGSVWATTNYNDGYPLED